MIDPGIIVFGLQCSGMILRCLEGQRERPGAVVFVARRVELAGAGGDSVQTGRNESGKTSVNSISAYLAGKCAFEIDAIRTRPWVLGAAADTVDDEAIGTWACQGIAWGEEYYGRVFAAARSAPGLPAATAAAFAWLNESISPEVDRLNKLAAGYPVAPGAHELWPDFTGYGAWMLVTARKGPAEARTALYACEDSCHRAFTVVRDARPLADVGALTHDAAVRTHRRAGELGPGPPSARWVRWPVLPGFFPVLASVPPAPAIAATGALA